jgi:hypothetical protein
MKGIIVCLLDCYSILNLHYIYFFFKNNIYVFLFLEINDTNPTLVDCMKDITHPDEKYGLFQHHYGTYQPSQDVIFSNYSKSNDYTGIMTLMIMLSINDENYKPAVNNMLGNAFDIAAFDSG